MKDVNLNWLHNTWLCFVSILHSLLLHAAAAAPGDINASYMY